MHVTYRFWTDCYLIIILPSGQGGGEMAQFGVQIGTIRQGLGNFLAIDFAEPLAQPMHGHTRGSFVHAQLTGHAGVVNRPAFRHQALFEDVKLGGTAGGPVLGLQAVDRQVKQGQCPLLVEGLIGSKGLRVGGVTGFGQGGVKLRAGLTTTTPLCGMAAPFLVHEMFQRHDEIGPQLALFPVGGIEPALLKESAEKFLGEILGIRRRLPTAADVGVERIPVITADGFQRRRRFRRRRLTRGQHHRPPGVRKQARPFTGGFLTAHVDIVSPSITGNEGVVTGNIPAGIEPNDIGRSIFNYPPAAERRITEDMKTEDIHKICEAGLITADQRDRIIVHFHLKDDGVKFLAIVSFIGATLITAGIVLLISAHWDAIPGGVKIAAGLLLMLGAHGGGWWLREAQGHYRKTGEALQLAGSVMFLANIALVGQIYHLSSRPPNALLLWLAGIAALPWLLNSRAQFGLFLAALSVWFGCEINQRDSLIYCGNESQVLAYALLGLNFIGAGLLLRKTSFADFAPVAEKLGSLGLLVFVFPLTWAGVLDWQRDSDGICRWLIPALAVSAILATGAGIRHLPGLNRQWRLTWGGTLTAAAALLCAAFFTPREHGWVRIGTFDIVNAAACIGLFVFCLLQIQAGLRIRSRYLVNLGVIFIGLDIVSAYFGLFGTMARTGLMFIISGIFLMVFGVYLERKRRALLQQMKTLNQPEVA